MSLSLAGGFILPWCHCLSRPSLLCLIHIHHPRDSYAARQGAYLSRGIQSNSV
uniref:Uncharacterized protein n=1 Tax=Arundo donax TaxID=35708 RepID=A0A0A9C8U4_ARUDO